MVNNFNCVLVEWIPEHEHYVSEVYRMLKDQENKIFDLTYGEKNIMDYVEYHSQNNSIYVIIDNEDKVCAFFMLERTKHYKNIITSTSLHCAVRKHC